MDEKYLYSSRCNFISENKVIVDIKKNMEKLSETIVKSKVKSRYALEFNAG